jgi:outer membrane lipoprotein carrier protein
MITLYPHKRGRAHRRYFTRFFALLGSLACLLPARAESEPTAQPDSPQHNSQQYNSPQLDSRFACGGIATAGDPRLLEKVQVSYAKVTTVQASFAQVAYLSALDVQEVSTGRVWFQKPGKMRWRYESPEIQEFGIAGSEVVLYQETDKQVIVDAASSVLLSDLPVSFLLGLGNLKRDFTLLESCKGEGGTIISVVPKDAKSQQGVRLLKLAIAPETLRPLGAEVIDEAGNITTIRLINPTWNGNLAATDLVVNYPKGVDVVDRRK